MTQADSDRTSNLDLAIGIIFHLADGTIQSCNTDAEKILGYAAEQLIGTSSFELPWQTIHEERSSFSPETHPAIASLKTSQPCSDVVMGFYKPKGDLVWLSIDTLPLFKANNTELYGVEITFRDITEDFQTQITPQALSQKQLNAANASPSPQTPTEQHQATVDAV